MLVQEFDESTWRPVALTSRKMADAEVRYSVTERECLAIVHALKKWRGHLHGEPSLVVETDHLSLKWLMSLKEPRGRL